MFGKQIEKKDNVYLVSGDNSNELIKLHYNRYLNSFEKGEVISVSFDSNYDFKIFKDNIIVLNESNSSFDVYDQSFNYLTSISSSILNNKYFITNDYVTFQQSERKIKIYNIFEYLNSDVYSFSQVNRIDGANLSEYYFGISIVEDDKNENVIALGSNGGKVKIYDINTSYDVKYEIDGEFSERFGSSIILSGDTIMVSAPNKDKKKGSVYIYRLDGGVWNLVNELSGNSSYDYFGEYMFKYENSVFIYAKNKSKGNSGYINVYDFDAATSSLILTSKIDEYSRHKLNKNFVIFDNNLLIQSNSNKVLWFEKISDNWIFKEALTETEHMFGELIVFKNNRILIGSPNEEKAYIYSYDNVSNSISLSFVIDGVNYTNSFLNTNFGFSGAITDTAIIIGAPNYNIFRGAFFVFDLSGSFIEYKEGTRVNQQVGFLINAINDSLLFMNAYGVN